MFRFVEVNHEKNDVNTQAVIDFENKDAAVVAYHRSLAYAMSNENVLRASRNILNDVMGSVRRESYNSEDNIEGDYYIVKANTFVEGEASDTIFSYPNRKAALVAFHTMVADDMENDNVLSLSYIILVDGMIQDLTENWSR